MSRHGDKTLIGPTLYPSGFLPSCLENAGESQLSLGCMRALLRRGWTRSGCYSLVGSHFKMLVRSMEQMGGRGWECRGHASLLLVSSHPFPREGKRVWKEQNAASLKHYSFSLGSNSLELCPFSLQRTWLFGVTPTIGMTM